MAVASVCPFNSTVSNSSWAAAADCELVFNESLHGNDASYAHMVQMARTWTIVLIGTILVTITVLGNLLVLVAFGTDKSIRTVSNYFILSLALADVIIGVISMPLYTVYILVDNKWVFGRFMCKLWLSIDYTVSNASVGNLLVICCDRYFSITRPLTYRVSRTPRRALAMIVVAWVISALLWTPWIFLWPVIEGEERVPEDDCYIQFLMSQSTQTQIITIVTSVCAFYAPVTVMCGLYMRVFYETRKRRKALSSLQAYQRGRILVSKSVASAIITAVEPTILLEDSNTQLSTSDYQQQLQKGANYEGRKRPISSLLLSLTEENSVTLAATHRYTATSGLSNNSQDLVQETSPRSSLPDETFASANKRPTNVSRLDASASASASAPGPGPASAETESRSNKQQTDIDCPAMSINKLAEAAAESEAAFCGSSQMSEQRDSAIDKFKQQSFGNHAYTYGNSSNSSISKSHGNHGSNGDDDVAVAVAMTTLRQREVQRNERPTSSPDTLSVRGLIELRMKGTDDRPASTLPRVQPFSSASLLAYSPLHAQRSLQLDASRSLMPDSGDTSSHTSSVSKWSAVLRGALQKPPLKQDKGDSKALKTLAAILLAFIITWSPYNLFTIMNLYCECVQGWLYIAGYYLCYINSTINPVCYALCNTQFRRAFFKIIKCTFCGRKGKGKGFLRPIIKRSNADS